MDDVIKEFKENHKNQRKFYRKIKDQKIKTQCEKEDGKRERVKL